MSWSKGCTGTSADEVARLKKRIQVAAGEAKADIVIKNARWLDVFTGAWASGDIAVHDGVIVGVADDYEGAETIDAVGMYVVPGMIDAHVHIESSLMTPDQFAGAVLPHGTTSVIWDPHEIANVKGVDGIKWALDASENLPLSVFVMVPSCVPSTSPELGLETSGATLTSRDLEVFKSHPRVLGLAEMMNWPGLVAGDQEVVTKLSQFSGMRRDGHCPGLSGKALNAYGVAGIHSCHESTTAAEASEKLKKGIHVLIREGSCAKDADALLPLLTTRSAPHLAYCSDDRNPLDIEEAGHLDCVVNKALVAGHDPVDVFRASSHAVARMFGLDDRGAIAPGYRADLVLVRPAGGSDNFKRGIQIGRVMTAGKWFDQGAASLSTSGRGQKWSGRNIKLTPDGSDRSLNGGDFELTSTRVGGTRARVIALRPGQIVTDEIKSDVPVRDGVMQIDSRAGLNLIAVVERHHGSGRIGKGIVSGMGLQSGAIATSINHDCHNIIVTGSDPAVMAAAVGELAMIDGGIVVLSASGKLTTLRLPIGGLMTDEKPADVAERLRQLKAHAREIGCPLEEPFLQLSFLALPVIPNLKITDRGLVDGQLFKVVSVEV